MTDDTYTVGAIAIAFQRHLQFQPWWHRCRETCAVDIARKLPLNTEVRKA